MIKPFYPQLAAAALKDSDFYGLMSAIEILRIGRARERKLAERYLEKKLKAYEHATSDERCNSKCRQSSG